MEARQRSLITMARRYGFRLERHKKHLVFRNERGDTVVAAKTISCHRALANIESNFRNAAIQP
jgi:hypothetical protein